MMRMRPCTCPRSLDALRAEPLDLRTIRVDVVDQIDPRCGHKACYHHAEERIEVGRAWWEGLTEAQRAAALAHELAHAEGVRCESCADRRGGAILAAWGFTAGLAAESMSAIVDSRPLAHLDVREGHRIYHGERT